MSMTKAISFLALNVETQHGYLSKEALDVRDYLIRAGYMHDLNLFGTQCYVISGYDDIIYSGYDCEDNGLNFLLLIEAARKYGIVLDNDVSEKWIMGV